MGADTQMMATMRTNMQVVQVRARMRDTSAAAATPAPRLHGEAHAAGANAHGASQMELSCAHLLLLCVPPKNLLQVLIHKGCRIGTVDELRVIHHLMQ